MKDDLHLTFGRIFNHDHSALLNQLIDIQHHTRNRAESERWVEQLRFIDISSVPPLIDRYDSTCVTRLGVQLESTPLLVLPLNEQSEDDGSRYVAVSWRWAACDEPPPWGCDARESFEYRIKRLGKEPHKSRFPGHYLERVILFAQEKNISKIWVDMECIYQLPEDGDKDRELGTQIMDAVYGTSDFSVGLLTATLIHQSEVTLLAELLSKRAFVAYRDTEAPSFRPGVKFLELQTLILRILSDPRWTRAWIFQEDHLASDRMTLLVPHAEGLSTDGLPYNFGAIPGNLQVRNSAFRRAVTMFCLANNESNYRWPNTEILAKAKQYNIWNREEHRAPPSNRNKHSGRSRTEIERLSAGKLVTNLTESTYPSTTCSILEDICHRDLLKVEDRVSIMANAARFSKRLDMGSESALVKSDKYSLSAVLLALVLLNGEIFNHGIEYDRDDIMSHTVRSYLRKREHKFDPPMLEYQQSWIDHCRFKASTLHINQKGIEVQGFLFKLLSKHYPYPEGSKPNPVRLTRQEWSRIDRLAQSAHTKHIAPGRRFNHIDVKIINLVVLKLRLAYGKDCQLASFLETNLNFDLHPLSEQDLKPAIPYIHDGMAGLIQALVDQRELRLARLENESDSTPPSAIFIAPLRPNGWVGESPTERSNRGTSHNWVFTSWDNGSQNRRVQKTERLASMEVSLSRHKSFGYTDKRKPEQADNIALRSIAWVNGVWNVEGKRMGKFTFPIPGLTEAPSSPSVELWRKRKRDDSDAGDESEDSAA